MTVLTPSTEITSDEWDAAVGATEGTQLILAGPGTGKSEFLVQRAIHILKRYSDAPETLLVLTFSRRAAADLRRRILDALRGTVNDITATTFHGYANGLLDRHGDHLTEGGSHRLLTGPDQLAVVGQLLTTEDATAWPLTLRGILPSPTLASEVTDFLTRCRERLLDPPDIELLAVDRPEWRALPTLMRRYDRFLEDHDLIDYGTLIRRAIGVLGRKPELTADLTSVLVDEYQDTSPAQVMFLETIVSREKSLTVAADPAQSIYAFRGADPSNVAEFPERFGTPESPVIIRDLARSQRVPEQILRGAQRVLGPEAAAAPVEPAPHEGRLNVHVFDQETAEAEWIAAELERHHRLDRIAYSGMAVLTRSSLGFRSELAWALDRHGVPHDGEDTRLLDHPAVRIISDVATVTLRLSSPETPGTRAEIEALLRRLVLGALVAASVGSERELARQRHTREDLTTGPLTGVPELDTLLRDPSWATSMVAADGFWWLWEHLPGVERMVGDAQYAGYRRAWAELGHMLERERERRPGSTLADVVVGITPEDFDASPRLTHQVPAADTVTTTTLHQAKGLEFEVVFIANAVEGVFPDPSGRSRPLLRPELLDGDVTVDLRNQRLDEERRLAYTGTTRARRRAVWTATIAGIDESDRRPSRFLLEVGDVDDIAQLPSPYRPRSGIFTPISMREAGIELRRRVLDPVMPAPQRLAAVSILAESWEVNELPGVPEPGRDDGIIGEHPILSPSQAERYLACPRRYVLERRLGVTGGDLRYARFGQLIHSILETVERHAMKDGRPHAALDEALAETERVFATEADFGTPEMTRAWSRGAVDLLTRLYDNWPGSDTSPPLALEHTVELEVGGVLWTGRIDRIEERDGGTVVVDYKTSKNLNVGEVAQSLQLGFYVLALEADPVFTGPIEAEIWAPRKGVKPYCYDRENLGDTVALLGEAVSGILVEDWTPRPSSQCPRCMVRSSCPVWPEGRDAFR